MTTTEPEPANPLRLPWHADYDHDRLVLDTDGQIAAVASTPEQAAAIAEAVSAGDVDARREVARLAALVGHYRNRDAMTPSSRQHLLGEDAAESIQPENWYHERVEQPARALRQAALDAAASLELAGADPADPVVVALRGAVDRFNAVTPNWV